MRPNTTSVLENLKDFAEMLATGAGTLNLHLHATAQLPPGFWSKGCSQALHVDPAFRHVAIINRNGGAIAFRAPAFPTSRTHAVTAPSSSAQTASNCSVTVDSSVLNNAQDTSKALGSIESVQTHDETSSVASAQSMERVFVLRNASADGTSCETAPCVKRATLQWQLQQRVMRGTKPGSPKVAIGAILHQGGLDSLLLSRYEFPQPGCEPCVADNDGRLETASFDTLAASLPCQQWRMPHPIASSVMSPGGDRLVIGTHSGCVVVFDSIRNIVTRAIPCLNVAITAAAFLPGDDPRVLVTASNGAVRVCGLNDGTVTGPPELLHLALRSICFPLDCPLCLAGTECGRIVLYDVHAFAIAAELLQPLQLTWRTEGDFAEDAVRHTATPIVADEPPAVVSGGGDAAKLKGGKGTKSSDAAKQKAGTAASGIADRPLLASASQESVAAENSERMNEPQPKAKAVQIHDSVLQIVCTSDCAGAEAGSSDKEPPALLAVYDFNFITQTMFPMQMAPRQQILQRMLQDTRNQEQVRPVSPPLMLRNNHSTRFAQSMPVKVAGSLNNSISSSSQSVEQVPGCTRGGKVGTDGASSTSGKSGVADLLATVPVHQDEFGALRKILVALGREGGGPKRRERRVHDYMAALGAELTKQSHMQPCLSVKQ